MSHHESGEEYAGPASLHSSVGAADVHLRVEANLRGRFDPIDGRFHWYGRLAASPDLDAIGSGATVTLATEHGSAEGRLSDVDPWGRLRVSGVGLPPF